MRISRHQMFMEMARVVAKRSTCPRLNVGAVVVVENRVVSIGYNGSLPGDAHCSDEGCILSDGHCIRTIHAEVNALEHVKIAGDQWSLYVTNSPCQSCAEKILRYPIRYLFFDHPYHPLHPVEFLMRHGVRVFRIVPSGYIVDQFTKEVVDEAGP